MRGADRLAALGACVLLLAFGGCAQRWSFDPPGRIALTSALVPEPAVAPTALLDKPAVAPTPHCRASQQWHPVIPAGAAWADTGEADAVEPAVALWLTDDRCRPEPPEDLPCCEIPLRCRLAAIRGEAREQIRSDHCHAYSWPIARGLLWGIAGASVLANTSLDEDFQDWVQDDLRGRDTDRLSAVSKTLGDGRIFVPTYLGLALAGKLLSDVPAWDAVGEFGDRTSRAYLVGVPPMLVMQFCLGGSRPGERDDASYWRPFQDNNGASGHAFIGAVPFITAARMSHGRPAKACWYFLSALPAWSRVNDDRHYLSQALVGWWMAYLACESIDRTERTDGCFTLMPVVEPDTVGFAAVYRR
jgi:hypothetical protein